MKHGRPRRCSTPFAYDNHVVWTIGMSEDEDGWRREHAARVWQAIGCLVMVAQAWRLGLSAIDCDDRGHWPDWWVTP